MPDDEIATPTPPNAPPPPSATTAWAGASRKKSRIRVTGTPRTVIAVPPLSPLSPLNPLSPLSPLSRPASSELLSLRLSGSNPSVRIPPFRCLAKAPQRRSAPLSGAQPESPSASNHLRTTSRDTPTHGVNHLHTAPNVYSPCKHKYLQSVCVFYVLDTFLHFRSIFERVAKRLYHISIHCDHPPKRPSPTHPCLNFLSHLI